MVPLRRTVPAAGRPSPASTRASVVLPAPFGRPGQPCPRADLEGGALQRQLRASPQFQAGGRDHVNPLLTKGTSEFSQQPRSGAFPFTAGAAACVSVYRHRRGRRSRRPALRTARSISVPKRVVLHQVGPGRGGPPQPNRPQVGSRVRDRGGLEGLRGSLLDVGEQAREERDRLPVELAQRVEAAAERAQVNAPRGCSASAARWSAQPDRGGRGRSAGRRRRAPPGRPWR